MTIVLTPIGAGGAGTTLLEIRTALVQQSGHYELVVDADGADFSDNGADFHINAGQRWLSNNFEYKKGAAWLYQIPSSGESLITFSNARYVREVWIASTAAGRTQLEKKTHGWIRENYADVPLSTLTGGTPLYWCNTQVQLAPEQYAENATTLAADGMTDIDFLVYGSQYVTTGIIVMPPSDGTFTVEVLTRWQDKDLAVDTDVSFWSVAHPELLLDAARLSIERRLHRNTQGVNDFTAPLMNDLKQIEFDMVAEEASGPPEYWRMRG